MYFAEAVRQLLSDGLFQPDAVKRQKGYFKMFGRATVLALLHGCPGPRCFDPMLVSIITKGEVIPSPRYIRDRELGSKLDEVC